VPGGRTAGGAPIPISARDTSTIEGAVAVHLADVERDITGEVLDAAAPDDRGGVVAGVNREPSVRSNEATA
jgi:hypothetical protein